MSLSSSFTCKEPKTEWGCKWNFEVRFSGQNERILNSKMQNFYSSKLGIQSRFSVCLVVCCPRCLLIPSCLNSMEQIENISKISVLVPSTYVPLAWPKSSVISIVKSLMKEGTQLTPSALLLRKEVNINYWFTVLSRSLDLSILYGLVKGFMPSNVFNLERLLLLNEGEGKVSVDVA